jgi:flagellar hook assembly protein FlgD
VVEHIGNANKLLSLLYSDEDTNNDQTIPAVVKMSQNYPNPFNPETTISFSLPAKVKADLSIYNIKGQKVITLVSKQLDKGKHKVVWNGHDENGKSVSSGIYFYKLKTANHTSIIKKCMLLK